MFNQKRILGMKKVLCMFVSMALVCHAAFCDLTDAGLAVKKPL